MDRRLIEKEINWLLKEKYSNKLTLNAKKEIKKLKKGYPLAYLIGNQPFLDCKIDLRYKPLIPRSETEYWTEKVLEDIKKYNKKELLKIKILDLFAGSGCIGIAILKNVENIKVDFADIKRKNLKQIQYNLKINNIKKRYKLIKSDIFNSIGIQNKYNYILANPPYIAHNDKKVQLSVKKHEPSNALYSKKNGLEIIEQFLKKAKNYLKINGKIYMEFGYMQKKNIGVLLKNLQYKKYTFYKDQYNKWRYIIISN